MKGTVAVSRELNRKAAYSAIETTEDLYLRLRHAWRAETSFAPDEWTPSCPALGQCAVTALIVQDVFGGELLRGRLVVGTHYWNRLPDGREIDLTSEQFEREPVVLAVETSSRAYVLSYPATVDRYLRLLANLGFEGQSNQRRYAARSAKTATNQA